MKQRPFLALWTLAVIASVAAFVLHLALRGKTVDLGYKLGRARAEQARLREMKRVLSLEAASYETPQRVEMVAKTLLGMTPPPPERVITIRGFWPSNEAEAEKTAAGAEAAMGRPAPPAAVPAAAPEVEAVDEPVPPAIDPPAPAPAEGASP
ncbi:MAG: cell division protein FtsL [Polyangiaceae bacterium]|nr:cell division protein FtsL [Polyangiaceae bacterium]